MTWPVMWPAAGEARNAIVAATSAVVPARWFRVSAMSRCSRSLVRRPRKNSLPADDLLRCEESLLGGLTQAQRDDLSELLRVLLASLTDR
jgi:hypothetical protein